MAKKNHKSVDTGIDSNLSALVMDQIHDGIIVTDLQGRITYANDAECRMLQRTRDDLIGSYIAELGEDATRGATQRQILDQTLQQGSWRGEVINYTADGAELILDCRTQLVYDAQGNPVAVCGIATDITDRKHAEQALRENENNLAVTLDSIGDAVIVTDTRGCILRMNPVAERLTGRPLAAAHGRPLTEIFRIVNARTRAAVQDPVARVLQSGEVVGLAHHTMLIAADGREHQIADTAAPIQDADGRVMGVVLVFRDVTDEYRVQEMLRESEARYRTLFNSAAEGILVADCESHRLVYANPAACRMFGYQDAEMRGMDIRALHPADNQPELLRQFELMSQADKQSERLAEVPCLRKDGGIFYADISGATVVLDGRKCNVGFFADITARQQAQAEAQAAHERMLAVLDANPDPVYVADPETYELLYANRALAEALGPPDHRKCYTHLQNRTAPCPFCTNDKIMGKNFGRNCEWEFQNESNHRWYRCLDRGITWPDGRKVRYEMAVDITEQKNAQAALRETAERLATTLYSIGDGVISTDAQGCITHMNPVAARMCGWSEAESLGRPLTEVFRIFDAQTGRPVDDPVRKVLATGVVVGLANHTELVAKDGVKRQIADTAAPIKNRDGTLSGVVLVFSDVSEKYRLENALRESEQQFRLVFENAINGIAMHEVVLDGGRQPRDYIYLRVNPAFTQHTGWPVDAVLGKKITEIIAGESSDVPAPLIDIYGRVALTGAPVSFDYYFEHLNRHYQINAYQVGQGRFATIFQDVTAQHKARRQLEKSLQEKEILLRELYHRTKNNMQVICSLLSLQSVYSGDANVEKIFRETVDRIQTMALVHQKLYQAKDLSHLDLGDYIRDLTYLLFKSYRDTDATEVKLEFGSEPLTVLIDVAVPCGLILNELVTNSLKYAFPGRRSGVIKIRIGTAPDGRVELCYGDNGVGVPPEFDFRRQPSLGLQSVFALAEQQLQGEIIFHDAGPGVGCRLRFANKEYQPRI